MLSPVTASAPPRRCGARVLQILMALSMVLAFSWDADGNPNTENLPLVVLTTSDDAVDEVAGFRHDSPTSVPRTRPWCTRWLRSIRSTWRLDLWRATAAPERGP